VQVANPYTLLPPVITATLPAIGCHQCYPSNFGCVCRTATSSVSRPGWLKTNREAAKCWPSATLLRRSSSNNHRRGQIRLSNSAVQVWRPCAHRRWSPSVRGTLAHGGDRHRVATLIHWPPSGGWSSRFPTEFAGVVVDCKHLRDTWRGPCDLVRRVDRVDVFWRRSRFQVDLVQMPVSQFVGRRGIALSSHFAYPERVTQRSFAASQRVGESRQAISSAGVSASGAKSH